MLRAAPRRDGAAARGPDLDRRGRPGRAQGPHRCRVARLHGDVRRDPVGPGQQDPAEPATQPRHLGAHRHRVLVVAEHRRAEREGVHARRSRAHEQREQLGVPRRQRVAPDRAALDHGVRWPGAQVQPQPRRDPPGSSATQQPAAGHRLRQAAADAGHHAPLALDGHGDPVRPDRRADRGHPAVAVDDGRGAAHPPQDRGRHRPQRLEAGLALPPQVGLGEPHRRADQRHRRRVHGRRRPGDVDDPEQRPGPRVVHRRGGARPRVQAALVVLGGEQLHRRPARPARCRSRSCPTAVSVQAAPSVKPSASARCRTPLQPSRHSTTPSASVTTMMCCASSATAARLDRSPRSTPCERAGPAPLLQRLDPDRAAGRRPVGVVPVGPHPRPRPGHDAARGGRQRVPGQHRLVGAVQQVGVTAQVGAPAHCADRVVHVLILRRGRASGQRQDVRASQSVIRLLISSGRSTSMKCPTPSISSASEPGRRSP